MADLLACTLLSRSIYQLGFESHQSRVLSRKESTKPPQEDLYKTSGQHSQNLRTAFTKPPDSTIKPPLRAAGEKYGNKPTIGTIGRTPERSIRSEIILLQCYILHDMAMNIEGLLAGMVQGYLRADRVSTYNVAG